MRANDAVRRHYARSNIVPRLLSALRRAHGEDVPITPETLAPLDHFHRGGLAATRRLADLLGPPAAQEHILDLGCGIGGPARWIAAAFGCRVTGIDVTPEFCAAAGEFNVLTGQESQVRVLEGDIAAPPLGNAQFDAAYSHSAAMNVPDKPGFYREALRVLKPGGRLVLFVIATGPGGEPMFPLPFADSPAASFLVSPEQTQRGLIAAGFVIEKFDDVTDTAKASQRDYVSRLETAGLPALGWHILMGEASSMQMQANAARAFLAGCLTELEIVARRPR